MAARARPATGALASEEGDDPQKSATQQFDALPFSTVDSLLEGAAEQAHESDQRSNQPGGTDNEAEPGVTVRKR